MTVPNIFATQGGASGVSIPASRIDANFAYVEAEIVATNFAVTGIQATDATNLLSNTQWQINTALPLQSQIAQGTTSLIAAGTVSSYTTGSNSITFAVSGVNSLKANDLVVLAGAGIDSQLKISALRVQSVSGSPVDHFVAQAPHGYAPGSTGNGTIQQSATGDLSGVSGNGPDNWSKTASLALSLDNYTADIDPGAQRAILLARNGTTSDQYFLQTIPADIVDRLRGKTITLTFRVKQFSGTVGGARAVINVNGSFVTGTASVGSSYESVSVTVTVGNTATTIQAGFVTSGADGTNAYYLCKPHLAIAPSLPVNYYTQPRNEYVIPFQKMTPLTYDNASVTFPTVFDVTGVFYSFSFDAFAETNGAIYFTVPMISMQAEMISTSVGSPVAFRNQFAEPGLNFGVQPIYTQASGVINTGSGNLVLVNGFGVIYTITSGLAVTNFDIDINQYMVAR